MKSILFTKPKAVTLDCLKFLVEQGETLLGIVIYDKQCYEGSEFSAYCKEKGLPLIDFSEAEEHIDRYSKEIEMIYCNTFPKCLKKSWIDCAKTAAINFHSAPLPEYRGVFAYNFAFLNGETEFGVTCHFLAEGIDEGNIIEVLKFPYDFEHGNVAELVSRSNEYLFQLFCKTYFRFQNGERVVGTPQGQGIYYSRKDFEDAKMIQTTDDEQMILRRIRAFWNPPYEGAYIKLKGEKIFLIPEDNYRALMK